MQKSGWYQVDGDWYYLNDYGAGVVNCWRLKDGEYAYLGSDGKDENKTAGSKITAIGIMSKRTGDAAPPLGRN